MTRTRIHNLSISLDGFATGEGSAPMLPWGTPANGSTSGCSPPASARRSWALPRAARAPTMQSPASTSRGSVRRSWARASSARRAGRTTPTGRDGGVPTRRSTHRPSCSPTGRGRRSRWRAAPPSTSSTPRRPRPRGRQRGDQDVRIGGGPTVARDFIAAGLVDHVHLVQVPIVLGRGVRLWDGLEALEADYDVEAVSTPSGVTHLTFTRSG